MTLWLQMKASDVSIECLVRHLSLRTEQELLIPRFLGQPVRSGTVQIRGKSHLVTGVLLDMCLTKSSDTCPMVSNIFVRNMSDGVLQCLRPWSLDLSLRFSADSSKMPFSFYFLLPPDSAISLELMVPQKWFTYQNLQNL